MRIGIDARLWNETGVGRYIRNLVFELQTLDKKNEYVLFVQPPPLQEPLLLLSDNPRWKVVETSIQWHSLAEQLKFPKVLERESLDLMHFPYFSLPILYSKPFVVTIHDVIINQFPTGKASTLPYPVYQAKRFGYKAVLNHAIKKSKKIIVPLHAVEKDLLETLHVPQDKIVVTKEGVDISVSKSHKQPSEQGYFLYVGNAYPHKNLDRLVNAFVAFQHEQPHARLLLVGKDDYFYRQLEERVRVEKFHGITFRHDVDDDELFSLYTHARAFISSSLMEGFGLPPLEAMSVSCPLLLSDIPSFREVCRDVAFYFDPRDGTDLKEKMAFVYNLPQKEKKKHIASGLKRVKQFSWKKMSQETLAIYESSISIR